MGARIVRASPLTSGGTSGVAVRVRVIKMAVKIRHEGVSFPSCVKVNIE